MKRTILLSLFLFFAVSYSYSQCYKYETTVIEEQYRELVGHEPEYHYDEKCDCQKAVMIPVYETRTRQKTVTRKVKIPCDSVSN